MDPFTLTTPVAFFIFKRADTASRVFQEIRKARPPKLLIVADGPRNEAEAEKCRLTRQVVEAVDWECEVLRNYSEANLGCNVRMVSGLDWVFSQVEEAIILEDDCLPDPSFFRFCQELLERFRNDERIMMISGDNFQNGRRRLDTSYYYSRIFHIWGWASWRRAWIHNDASMPLWPAIRDGGWLEDIVGDPDSVRFYRKVFQESYEGTYNLSWDFKWNLSCWLANGLSVMPNVNLISNIGFGVDATYATDPNCDLANMPAGSVSFPLVHPAFMFQNRQADLDTMRKQFSLPAPVPETEPSLTAAPDPEPDPEPATPAPLQPEPTPPVLPYAPMNILPIPYKKRKKIRSRLKRLLRRKKRLAQGKLPSKKRKHKLKVRQKKGTRITKSSAKKTRLKTNPKRLKKRAV